MILSEVLSNEPAGRVRLEWIEIYNQAVSETNLGDYILIADSDTNHLPEGVFIGAQQYAVLARQLVPADGSDSFESYWGDSSGVWGDAADEDYTALDIDITLSNSSGNVLLMTVDGEVIDVIEWETASDDGRSIERNDINDFDSGWHDCFDPDGSTPGSSNSHIPQSGEESFSVIINPIVISISKGDFDDFSIDVIIPPGTRLSVKIFDESGYKVKSLADDSEISVSRLSWDGRDDKGRFVTPGIYIVLFGLTGRNNDVKNYPVVVAP